MLVFAGGPPACFAGGRVPTLGVVPTVGRGQALGVVRPVGRGQALGVFGRSGVVRRSAYSTGRA
jgi:hypothetical protein